MEARQSVKMVMVGDERVGKTNIALSYLSSACPGEYVSTIFDNYTAEFINTTEGKIIDVSFWDTAGNEDFSRLRPLVHPQTDVFLLVFSLVDPNSFEKIRTYYFPEVAHHCPNTPIILIGTKSNLVSDPNTLEMLSKKMKKPVEEKEAIDLCKEIGAQKYISCGALTDNLFGCNVFSWGITAALTPIPPAGKGFFGLIEKSRILPSEQLLSLSGPSNFSQRYHIGVSSDGTLVLKIPKEWESIFNVNPESPTNSYNKK